MYATCKQGIIYGASRLVHQMATHAHKVYNWVDMDLDIGLDYDPNTIDHKTDTDSTESMFTNCIKI